jgi:hypothetical protein
VQHIATYVPRVLVARSQTNCETLESPQRIEGTRCHVLAQVDRPNMLRGRLQVPRPSPGHFKVISLQGTTWLELWAGCPRRCMSHLMCLLRWSLYRTLLAPQHLGCLEIRMGYNELFIFRVSLTRRSLFHFEKIWNGLSVYKRYPCYYRTKSVSSTWSWPLTVWRISMQFWLICSVFCAILTDEVKLKKKKGKYQFSTYPFSLWEFTS